MRYFVLLLLLFALTGSVMALKWGTRIMVYDQATGNFLGGWVARENYDPIPLDYQQTGFYGARIAISPDGYIFLATLGYLYQYTLTGSLIHSYSYTTPTGVPDFFTIAVNNSYIFSILHYIDTYGASQSVYYRYDRATGLATILPHTGLWGYPFYESKLYYSGTNLFLSYDRYSSVKGIVGGVDRHAYLKCAKLDDNFAFVEGWCYKLNMSDPNPPVNAGIYLVTNSDESKHYFYSPNPTHRIQTLLPGVDDQYTLENTTLIPNRTIALDRDEASDTFFIVEYKGVGNVGYSQYDTAGNLVVHGTENLLHARDLKAYGGRVYVVDIGSDPGGFAGVSQLSAPVDQRFGLDHVVYAKGGNLYYRYAPGKESYVAAVNIGAGTKPSLVVLPSRRLSLVYQDSTGAIQRRYSRDLGKTWEAS